MWWCRSFGTLHSAPFHTKGMRTSGSGAGAAMSTELAQKAEAIVKSVIVNLKHRHEGGASNKTAAGFQKHLTKFLQEKVKHGIWLPRHTRSELKSTRDM